MPWLQRLRHLYSERHSLLWVSPAITSVIAVVVALAAAALPRLFPSLQLPDIERETLSSLLTVIASSMLAVTTFSLSIMVSAFAAAANGATPRATELLMQDEGTRTAISAFLSAFIFAVVAQIALGLQYYGSNGRFVLFIATVAMLAYLIITLIRWVRTLSMLGRFGNTMERIEQAASQSCLAHARRPFLGARAGAPQPPAGTAVAAARVGYVRRIDMAALQELAEQGDLHIHLRVRPGQFVCLGHTVAVVQGAPDRVQPLLDDGRLLACILIAAGRSFEQDPRFGLIVLSEVGQRAMSTAINDPGNGLAALTAMTRTLLGMPAPSGTQQPCHDRLSMVALDEQDLVFDSFDPIASDGAGNLVIAIRMQKLLAMLARTSARPAIAQAARVQAQRAAARHRQALNYSEDRQTFEQARQQAWQAD